MEESPTWKASSCSTTQEFLNLLWSLNFHYRILIRPQLDPVLSQMNPVHSLPIYFFKIHVNIVFMSMPWSSSWSLPLQILGPKFCVHFSLLPCALHIPLMLLGLNITTASRTRPYQKVVLAYQSKDVYGHVFLPYLHASVKFSAMNYSRLDVIVCSSAFSIS
jgi:hypothetical protein